MLFEIIIEDESGRAPNQADLEGWAERYGLTMPVLADPNGTTLWSFVGGGSVGLPFTVLIDRGVVTDVNYPTERDWDRILD